MVTYSSVFMESLEQQSVSLCKVSRGFNNSVNTAYEQQTSELSSIKIHRGSYMSAHVLLNLLNELGKRIKCEACRAFYLFFATSLINSIVQEHEC